MILAAWFRLQKMPMPTEIETQDLGLIDGDRPDLDSTFAASRDHRCRGAVNFAGVRVPFENANRDLAWRASRKMNLKADVS